MVTSSRGALLVEPSSSLDELEPEPELALARMVVVVTAHTLRAGLLRGPR